MMTGTTCFFPTYPTMPHMSYELLRLIGEGTGSCRVELTYVRLTMKPRRVTTLRGRNETLQSRDWSGLRARSALLPTEPGLWKGRRSAKSQSTYPGVRPANLCI